MFDLLRGDTYVFACLLWFYCFVYYMMYFTGFLWLMFVWLVTGFVTHCGFDVVQFDCAAVGLILIDCFVCGIADDFCF